MKLLASIEVDPAPMNFPRLVPPQNNIPSILQMEPEPTGPDCVELQLILGHGAKHRRRFSKERSMNVIFQWADALGVDISRQVNVGLGLLGYIYATMGGKKKNSLCIILLWLELLRISAPSSSRLLSFMIALYRLLLKLLFFLLTRHLVLGHQNLFLLTLKIQVLRSSQQILAAVSAPLSI